MTNVDQIALTFRVMHPQDRLWLLSQLSDSEKAAIRERVADGRGAGVTQPSGFDLVIAREGLAMLPASDVVSRLLTLDASQIADAFEREPDWLVGIVLDAYRWPWHNTVLEGMGPDRKARILRLCGQGARAPLVDSILRNLFERARAVVIKSPASSIPARPLPSLLLRIQRWLQGFIK